MTWRKGLPHFAALVAVACGAPHQDSADTLEAVIAASPLVPVCGTVDSATVYSAFVTYSARHCISCQEFGYLLRHRDKVEWGSFPDSFAILTASADAGVVCENLRRERIKIAHFAFDAPGGIRTQLRDSLFLVRRDVASAKLRRSLSGQSLRELLAASVR